MMTGSDDVKDHTVAGVTSGIFENDTEVKKELKAGTVAEAFKQLKKEVDEYYGESD